MLLDRLLDRLLAMLHLKVSALKNRAMTLAKHDFPVSTYLKALFFLAYLQYPPVQSKRDYLTINLLALTNLLSHHQPQAQLIRTPLTFSATKELRFILKVHPPLTVIFHSTAGIAFRAAFNTS